MAITRAQQAKQMLQSGGEVLGPLGENNLTNQLSPGTISRVVPNIGRGLAFILSGGLSGGVSAVAEELAKQKILDEAAKKAGDVIRPRLLTQVMQEDNRARGIGGYQSDFAQDSDFMGGKGTAAEMGSFADGGNVVGGEFDFESARQMYGLGKLVKKVTRSVKKIAKSPVGKAAIAAALFRMSGGLSETGFLKSRALPFLVGTSRQVGPQVQTTKGILGAGGRFDPFKTILATSGITGLMAGQEEEDETVSPEELGPGLNIPEYRRDPFGNLAIRYRAEGGSTEQKEPVAKKTMPLLDMGGMEKDYREDGGFVPIGRMEKADDVPARLSKNEFVFTADAVRNAGDGDVDKGAEVMYNMMKNLEAGGEVSEESQGLEGARRMFQTSQRLEEVL